MGFVMKSYRCKDCGKRCRAWAESQAYKEELCPKCLDKKGLGVPLPRVNRKPISKERQVTYASKRWLKTPKPISTLIRDLGYRLVGTVSDDDFIVQRRGERRPVFYMLHISWGDASAVEKYKLFRIDPFMLSNLQDAVEVPEDDELVS